MMGCLIALLMFTAPGDDDSAWRHVRGQKYDGHTTWSGIQLPWSGSGPPVLWKKPHCQGFSGCVIAGGRIYTQTQFRAGQCVLCLDLETGEELWRTRYGWPWENAGEWPGPYASPTYSEGRVYFAGCYGVVGCVDALDGRMIWSVDLRKVLEADLPGFGYACTPLVERGRVYLATSGEGCSMVALEAKDGRVVWKVGDDTASYSSCVMLSVGGRDQVVCLLENVNVGRDPETGAELWRFPWSSAYDPQCTWPLYDEPFFYRASPFLNGCRVVRLGQLSPEVVWESKILSSCIFSGVVVDGCIYAFDLQSPQTESEGGSKGRFKCVELATGRERWSTGAVPHSTVLACGDKLLLLGERGTLVVAEADPHAYREVGRRPLLEGQRCWTLPSVHDGYLVARGGTDIVCVYLGDPGDLGGRVLDQVASAGTPLTVRIGLWLDRYQDASFWQPRAGDLAIWFVACLAVVFAPALLAAWAAKGRLAVFFVVSSLLALITTPLSAPVFNRVIFTWPAGLYALLLLAILAGRAFRHERGMRAKVLPRAALLFFCLVCAGYYLVCSRMFFVTGVGFLAGLLAGVPLAYPVAHSILKEGRRIRALVAGFVSFSAYYWISALFILWKTSW